MRWWRVWARRRTGHWGRNSTIPAVRALAGRDDPLATLTRLWPLQQPVSRTALDQALPGLVAPLVEAEVLAESGGQVRAEIDIRPYASDDGDFWVVSDLSPNLDTASRRCDQTWCSACRPPPPPWPS
jgi:hypothetical protein